MLAISGDCGHLFLARHGEIFQELNGVEFRFGSDFRPSRDGNRFVFSRSRSKPHSDKIFGLEVCVYDILRKGIIFTVPVVPMPQHKLGYALSPEGDLFALQSDNLLRVWSLSN